MLLPPHQSVGQNHFTNTDPLEICHSSNIWEHILVLRRKLRRDWIWIILATIQSRALCCLLFSLQCEQYKTINLPVVLCGSEICSLTLRHTDWGCFRTGYQEYFDPSGMKYQAARYYMRSLKTSILCQIWLEWPHQGGWDCRVCSMNGKKDKCI